MNISTAFIDFFAKIGWASDLKTASKEIIERRANRTGDGSRHGSRQNQSQHHDEQTNHIHTNENLIWGWDDVDMNLDDKKYVTILNRM